MIICYFGIYKPTAPRDKIYLGGLKSYGVRVIECVDSSPSFLKFWRLAKKHWPIRKDYDVMMVGYLSTMAAPLAKLISRKKIIFNALGSWYETAILDREMHSKYSLTAQVIWLFDFLAFHLVDIVLVESNEQKKYIAKKFKVNDSKLRIMYTGADEEVFFPDSKGKKSDTFTVVFRGLFLPATGVEYVIEAAKVLKNQDINFIIIGWGQLLDEVKGMIHSSDLGNVKLIDYFLSPDELRKTMFGAHVMLGQFAAHERMGRTIQNKTFEAMALGMPYITRDSASNRELLEDRKNCLFVKPDDPNDLAKKILELKNNPALRENIASEARKLYEEKLTSKILGKQLFDILVRVLD